ncbi:hypothetical protein KRZ98_12270 [Sphingobium sp. AS12]|uniref:hypothetical protein n=1 Tax=Sphingobium sp. AS12 TaxID=2849495 RepID=UPI001C31BEE8|nr:hypothetical protein [Sphingobium sp. AS12]MBV2149055.1 hypothetical protein [Sphingobium sp. AS12]
MAALRLIQLPEPLLGFGYQQRMEHPKDGLFLFGPLADDAHPAEMRVGVIGTEGGIERFRTWAKRARGYIPSANSEAAHHASWPGFEAVFDTKWPERPITEIKVDGVALADAIRIENRHEAISKAVGIFETPIRRYLRQSEAPPTMWFVVIPEDVHRFGRPKSNVPRGERSKGDAKLSRRAGRFVLETGSLFQEEVDAAEIYRFELNFHHQLKAKLLSEKAVVQIVRETTLTPDEFVDDKGRQFRSTQDPATIAWNLCTTAFFKSSGKPWRLAEVRPGVCYVGLVFKKDDTALGGANACCGAQMFLDSGDGVVFRGAVGPWYSEADKSFHLTKEKAAELMTLIVEAYHDMHGIPPAELFIHGKARFSNDEWEGFSSAVPPETQLVGVRIRPTNELKLLRLGKTAVQRGTAYLAGDRFGYLWTKGFVARLATYPGWEVPNPLLVEIHRGEADLQRVMTDVLGLTKINFNACVYADGLPVTLKFADAVGDILTAAPVGDLPPLPFRHYI